MSSPFGSFFGRGNYGNKANIFDHVTSPINIQMNARSHNSLESSPLFTAASLPQRASSRDINKNSTISQIKTFSFANLNPSNSHRSYPSVFVNGAIVDVNDIVRDIVTNRPHSNYSGPDSGSQSFVCPFSHVPITCPVRGVSCNHAQCFDLREFLIAQDNEDWKCPICNQPLTIDTIQFDPFYFSPQSPSPQINQGDGPMAPTDSFDMWESRDPVFDQGFDM